MKNWSLSIAAFTLGAVVASSACLVGCDSSSEPVVVDLQPHDSARSLKDQAAETDTAAPAAANPHGAALNQHGAAPNERASDAAAAAQTEKAQPAALADAASPSSTSTVAQQGETPVLKRLVIANDVREREPVQDAPATVSSPVVAFLELANQTTGDAAVMVTFEHESGKKVGFIELSVPGESPRYRTWGRTRNITEPGEWTAVVSTKEGHELGRTVFSVRS